MISRDVCAGLLMVVVGAAAVALGAQNTLGTLTRMGPGFFPIVLGLVLAATGVAIALAGLGQAPAAASDPQPPLPDLRGMTAIITGIAAFIVVGKWFGLAPATFVSVLMAAAGDRAMTIRGALVLASALTVIAVVGFSYLLQIQFPILRSPI